MIVLNDMGCETMFSGIIGIPCTYTAGDGMRYLDGDHLGRHFETETGGKEEEMAKGKQWTYL